MIDPFRSYAEKGRAVSGSVAPVKSRVVGTGMDLAAEPAGESIARENEIVAQVARADVSPVRDGAASVEEQLGAQIDADVIRGRAGPLPRVTLRLAARSRLRAG